MTKKDFELIAKVLSNFTGDNGDVIDRDRIGYRIADALGETNPRFDKEKFLIASGVIEKCARCEKSPTHILNH